MGASSLLKFSVPHIASVFCKSLSKCLFSLSHILLTALVTVDAVDQVKGLAVYCRLDVCLESGGCGCHHLPRLDIGAGKAVIPAPLHTLELALRSCVGGGTLALIKLSFRLEGLL